MQTPENVFLYSLEELDFLGSWGYSLFAVKFFWFGVFLWRKVLFCEDFDDHGDGMWKTNKATPISQVVSDIQSPERGDFLFQGAGLPTSAVDLFVKNKERFVKAKTKKIRVEVLDQVRSDKLPPPPPAPYTETFLESSYNCLGVDVRLVVAQLGRTETKRLRWRSCQDSTFDGGFSVLDDDQNRMKESGEGSNPILRSNKLSVRIIMSASMLLLGEHIGRRVDFFRKPCSDTKIAMEYLIRSVSDIAFPRKFVLLSKGTDSSQICMQRQAVATGYEYVSSSTCSSSSSDFWVLGTEVDKEDVRVKKVNIGGDDMNLGVGYKTSDCLDVKGLKGRVSEECEDCVPEIHKLKLYAKIKFNMKLVAKKLRRTIQERKNKEKEVSSPSSEAGSITSADQSNKSEKSKGKPESGEKDHGRESPSLALEECCSYVEGRTKKDRMACSNVLPLQATKKVCVIGEKKRILTGYLILFLILAGLLVGRVAALLLIMTSVWWIKLRPKT